MAKRPKKKTRKDKIKEGCKSARTPKKLINELNKITTEELINDVSRKL